MKIQYHAERIYPDREKWPDGDDMPQPWIETKTEDDTMQVRLTAKSNGGRGMVLTMSVKEAGLLAATLLHGSVQMQIK